MGEAGRSGMQSHRVRIGVATGGDRAGSAIGTDTTPTNVAGSTHAVLVLTRLRPGSVPWAVWRLALGSKGLGRVPGLSFARVLGSGRDAGFGLVPGLDVQGVFAAFHSLDAAEAWADRGPGLQGYIDRAIDHLRVTLRVTSARGAWDGDTMSPAPEATPDRLGAGAVVAALTRASIRPAHLASFWRHSPPAERGLAHAAGCRLAVGLGEAPLLRQATFSIWDDVASMNAYARGGAHGQAIRSAWKTGYFSESMFVRFAPVRMRGHWPGAVFA